MHTLFRLPVHDTQTGLKLFKREPLMRVMPRLLVKRFAYDLELLVNLHRDGYKIVEAPVVVTRTRAFPRIGVRDARLVARTRRRSGTGPTSGAGTTSEPPSSSQRPPSGSSTVCPARPDSTTANASLERA